MCTATEAKTLQRVHGRYNSFFRKVIPVKRVQKPIRWYTRLTVYGNPGRVVNGCAPGIPVLICGFGVVVCGEGLQWGFAEGAAFVLVPRPRPKEAAGAHLPALLQGNPPSRALRSLLASLRRAPERVP